MLREDQLKRHLEMTIRRAHWGYSSRVKIALRLFEEMLAQSKSACHWMRLDCVVALKSRAESYATGLVARAQLNERDVADASPERKRL